MSFVLGSDGLGKDYYMKLSSMGQVLITATPLADNKEIMSVDIVVENRTEPIHMTTNKDETVDQFAQRIKSALRGLWNAPVREPEGKPPVEVPAKKETFEEQKAKMKERAK